MPGPQAPGASAGDRRPTTDGSGAGGLGLSASAHGPCQRGRYASGRSARKRIPGDAGRSKPCRGADGGRVVHGEVGLLAEAGDRGADEDAGRESLDAKRLWLQSRRGLLLVAVVEEVKAAGPVEINI